MSNYSCVTKMPPKAREEKLLSVQLCLLSPPPVEHYT